jgi:hypothetical protein
MLQLFFAKQEVCQDLLAGPMGPYLPSLAVKLSELGYTRDHGQRLLLTADALGRWLQVQGISPTEATAAHVRAYANSQPRTPAGNLPDTATGLSHVVEFLKPWGILCQPPPCSSADQWVQRFDDHLQKVRGLAPSTRHSYALYVRRFLKETPSEKTLPIGPRLRPQVFAGLFRPRSSTPRPARGTLFPLSAPFYAFWFPRDSSQPH